MLNRSAVVLSLTDPHRTRHGGTLRTRQLIALLECSDYTTSVVFPRRDGAVPPASESRLRALKRNYLPMPTRLGAVDEEMKQRAASYKCSICVASVITHVPIARATRAPIWVDFMDVWSEFGRREAHRRRGLARFTSLAQATALQAAELRACSEAGLVTAAGWADCEVLRSRGVDATWMPTTLPDSEFTAVPSTAMHKTVGLLGNFIYTPNIDSYHYMVEHWLESILRSGYRVVVAGKGSHDLGTPPHGVDILGEVDDLEDYYSLIDVSLAPIRLGGGIKVKVLESLAKGKPVLGTDVAFEGFPEDIMKFCAAEHEGDISKSLASLEPVDVNSPELNVYRAGTMRETMRNKLEMFA